MQNSIFLRKRQATRFVAAAVAGLGFLALTGCGMTSTPLTGTISPGSAALVLQGSVHGGQQPVSGATIQLYAANMTGYGLASTALISTAVTSNASGGFTITGDYTCPYATSQVYLTATGGNPGSGTNANLLLVAPLGSCGNLTPSTFINVNELTTVAGAYALAPFMSSPTQLSTTATNLTGLTNAFATVNKLVNVTTGNLPGSTLPTGATEPVAELNTLANIMASCVNSNGVGGGSTACANLFAAATPPAGTAPTDTLTAMLNIAKNPGNNASALFSLSPAAGPFQPTQTSAPSSYTVSIRYAPAGTFSTPSASAIDAAGNVWVTNAGSNTIAVLGATSGTPTLYSGGGLNAPSGIAFDASGNAWIPNKGNSTLSAFTSTGTGAAKLTSSLSSPSAVAIDGQGLIWVTNSGNATVTAVASSGTTVSGATVYATSGTSPNAVAINPR